MQGILIYERENAPRNKRYIELFMAAAKKRGVTLTLCFLDELSFGAQEGSPFLFVRGETCRPDFAVPRLMHPVLSEYLEAMGVKVFNNANVSRICNDKRQTALHFLRRGLPFVQTVCAQKNAEALPFSYPVVVKAAKGCGGRQVFLCENMQRYHAVLDSLGESPAVVQPFLHAGGRDVRVYMLGGEIYQAMERYSDNMDFRSNFGIHGLARTYCLPNHLKQLAYRAVEGLHASLVGVDFLFDEQGKAYLNEIEDAVGTRMLYQFTSHDVVDDYMQLIVDTGVKNI